MTPFDAFFEAYPKERRTYPKSKMLAKYEKAMSDTTPIEMLESLETYKARVWTNGWRFVPQMSKWFNQEYWRREFDAVNTDSNYAAKSGVAF